MRKTNNYRIELCCGVAYLFLLFFSNYPAYVNLMPIIILGFVRLFIVIFVLLMDAKRYVAKQINKFLDESNEQGWRDYE